MKFKVLNNYALGEKGVIENPYSGENFFLSSYGDCIGWREDLREAMNVPHSQQERLKDSNTTFTAKMLTK